MCVQLYSQYDRILPSNEIFTISVQLRCHTLCFLSYMTSEVDHFMAISYVPADYFTSNLINMFTC